MFKPISKHNITKKSIEILQKKKKHLIMINDENDENINKNIINN
jgi:hypothetical protein